MTVSIDRRTPPIYTITTTADFQEISNVKKPLFYYIFFWSSFSAFNFRRRRWQRLDSMTIAHVVCVCEWASVFVFWPFIFVIGQSKLCDIFDICSSSMIFCFFFRRRRLSSIGNAVSETVCSLSGLCVVSLVSILSTRTFTRFHSGML